MLYFYLHCDHRSLNTTIHLYILVFSVFKDLQSAGCLSMEYFVFITTCLLYMLTLEVEKCFYTCNKLVMWDGFITDICHVICHMISLIQNTSIRHTLYIMYCYHSSCNYIVVFLKCTLPGRTYLQMHFVLKAQAVNKIICYLLITAYKQNQIHLRALVLVVSFIQYQLCIHLLKHLRTYKLTTNCKGCIMDPYKQYEHYYVLP